MKKFSTRLIHWHESHGRKDLPWQKRKTPYKVWISEIILQQTQVITAIPYFKKFIVEFPNIKRLSESNLDQVLKIWSGLGYYARARNLHKTAKIISTDFGDKIPNSLNELMDLPGIGRSTAGAILALGFKKKAPILDANVKRVLARYFKVEGDIQTTSKIKELWKLSSAVLPNSKIDIYTQSIMDLGATVCTKSNPSCMNCPLKLDCLALKEGLVENLPLITKRQSKLTKKVFWLLPQIPSGEILLEKRKEEGIWGGLWTFIEEERKEDLKIALSNRFDLEKSRIIKLDKIKHSFSHYHLEATPYVAKVKNKKKFKNSVWVNNKNVESLGVPTPIKRTIRQISMT